MHADQEVKVKVKVDVVTCLWYKWNLLKGNLLRCATVLIYHLTYALKKFAYEVKFLVF